MESNYIGFLFLFPIDKKYDYIIEDTFHILFKKKLQITSSDLKKIFRVDERYTSSMIDNKTVHNIGDGDITIYLIASESTEYVNEYEKKIGRRKIDNIRYETTGVYRKAKIWQNHFHTTDTIKQVQEIIKYLVSKRFISNVEEKKCYKYIDNRENMKIKFIKNIKILEDLYVIDRKYCKLAGF